MKRLSCIILCAVVTSIFLSCCDSDSKQRSERHYTLASLKGPSAIGMLPLIDSLDGTQAQTLSITISPEPLLVRKMMLDGSADFAVLPMTMAALLYNKGLDYQLIAVPIWGSFTLCGNDDNIKDWNDLKGKRVHLMAKGMTPDVLFRYLLKENGLTPYEDVELDYRFPNHIDLANAVLAGRTELAVLSEPYLSLAMLKNNNIKRIFNLGDKWTEINHIPIAETALLCKKEILENDPEFVDNLIRLYSQSTEWVNNNNEEAAALAVKHDIIPDSIAAKNSIPHSNLKVKKSKDVKDIVKQYLNVFFEMDPQIIGDKMPDEEFYQ